jgi:hypothetical protein
MSGTTGGGPSAPAHPLEAQLAAAQAQFKATGMAVSRMEKIRAQMASLAKLGPSVTPEDVIEHAGKLVSGGEDPVQLAGLMSDMPVNGGEALAAWVAMHEQTTAQNEAKLAQAHEAARHQLGVASLHELVRHSMEGGGASAQHPPNALAPAANPQSQSPSLDPASQGNALSPGGSSPSPG